MPIRGTIEHSIVAAALMRARNIEVIVTIMEDAIKSLSAAPGTEAADIDAYSDEAGHAFQNEAGHLFRSEAGRGSDLMSATGASPQID
ncbi:MAG TPA: hypothetical protein VIJ17_01960 [Pseudolabrys sp.]